MNCILTDNAAFYSATDNVATTVMPIAKGTVIQTPSGILITLLEDIPMNHKFSIRTIEGGGRIRKYGHIIGAATKDITIGSHVHIHNVVSARNGKKS